MFSFNHLNNQTTGLVLWGIGSVTTTTIFNGTSEPIRPAHVRSGVSSKQFLKPFGAAGKATTSTASIALR